MRCPLACRQRGSNRLGSDHQRKLPSTAMRAHGRIGLVTPSSGSPRHDRLQELASLADSCRAAFLAVGRDSHWKPGTAARARVDAMTAADPASSADGIMAGADLVSEVVVSYLEIAAGHLGGLAALLRADEVMFSPQPLVRAIMENCARVFWVIGMTVDPPGVLARAYLEEFHSCEYQKAAAKRLGGGCTTTPEYIDARTRRTTVRARARAAFPGTTNADLSEDKPGRSIGAHTLPSPTDGVTAMVEVLHHAAAGSITADVAEGVYDFLSNHTHPTLYPIRQLRRYIDHGDHVGTELHLELESTERLLGAAVSAFYSALSFTMSFYDLPRGSHDALTTQIDDTLPQLFTVS